MLMCNPTCKDMKRRLRNYLLRPLPNVCFEFNPNHICKTCWTEAILRAGPEVKNWISTAWNRNGNMILSPGRFTEEDDIYKAFDDGSKR